MAQKLPPLAEGCPQLLDEWHAGKNTGVDPQSLSCGSHTQVWWLCSVCGHEWRARISNRARKGQGCPKCRGSVTDPSKSFAALFPDLLAEWHPQKNEGLDPHTISRGSARRVWWQCRQNPKHEWEALIFNRTGGGGACPECNSLAVLYPDIAAQWHPTKNKETAEQVTGKSGKNVWWKCPTCLNEWRAIVKNRTHTGSKCPLCARDDAVLQAKINKLDNEEDTSSEYSYDAEERVFLRHQEIQSIFKRFLKIESESRSIESLFSPRTLDRIDYQPHYQRNYVWDTVKGTYFIESVLIGTEVPPLIFYESAKGSEVIDGRQRFETLLRFHCDRLSLSAKGLTTLKSLANNTFSSLDDSLRDLFYDTKMRLIKFTVVDESRFDERLQDMLKKEVFRRYNSGITPLRRLDVERAVYIHDDPTKHFKHQFSRNKFVYEAFVRLFLAESDRDKLDEKDTREKCAQKVRFLLVVPEMSVMSARRKATLDQFYDHFSESESDVQNLYKSFLEKLHAVLAIEEHFCEHGDPANRYWYECVFWAVAVLEKEGIEVAKFQEMKQELLKFYRDNATLYAPDESPFLYRQTYLRYHTLSQFLENYFGLSLSVYIQSSSQVQKAIADNAPDAGPDSYLRIERQEPVPHSIDDICRMMNRRRFTVRPAYQRGEVINKSKSSAIIESILLGVKLPPLYIFKRDNDALEVIDGQQRLLSILGFAGLTFKDEAGNEIQSKKHEYSLANLRILDDLNGKTFADLSQEQRDAIYDFPLSLIIIDEKFNPHFDPIDLFVRLNSRPYPIKENTFEMWNSYVDKDIIDEIKQLTERHAAWFYVTSPQSNVRMRNEELITILAFLEYRKATQAGASHNVPEFMDVFRRESTIGVRIRQKSEVTNLLNQATIDTSVREQFAKCLRRTDAFIRRLRTILIDKEVVDASEYLNAELTSIFDVQKKRHYTRRFQDFYSLWYITEFLTQELVNERRLGLKPEVAEIIAYMKKAEKTTDVENVIDEFHEIIADFRDRHKVAQRRVKLDEEEKAELIRKQNNKCPLCDGPLFIHDELEVDHANSLAKGGKDRFLNLQITHKQCNRRKGVG
ncbi:zinc-ribbon domain-containing protein [Planctomycetota bacterium]